MLSPSVVSSICMLPFSFNSSMIKNRTTKESSLFIIGLDFTNLFLPVLVMRRSSSNGLMFLSSGSFPGSSLPEYMAKTAVQSSRRERSDTDSSPVDSRISLFSIAYISSRSNADVSSILLKKRFHVVACSKLLAILQCRIQSVNTSSIYGSYLAIACPNSVSCTPF